MFILILLMILFHHSISQPLFGTQTFRTSLASQSDLLQKLGVRIVRLLVSWRQLEETGKSQYQSWYLKSMDKDVQVMTQLNIKIILQMAQTPCWASTSTNCTLYYYRPKNYNDYADTMLFLLNRYGNNISAWEIWNEPNIKTSWLRPECQSTDGLCPRPADLNDEWMEFIDLVAAQEYSQMVQITSQKMKAISPNVTILAGSLAGSDIDYLNEMYKSGIKNFYDGLAMHPYTSYFPQGTSEYGKEYGPEECFLSTRASKFWCFTRGVERIRDYMIQQMDSSKFIWFTEFGFSSFNGWNGAGLQGQADYLGLAIDIIRTQWPFVHAACVYEYSDGDLVDDREGFFGLLYRNYTMKPSGLVFTKKVKNVTNDIILASSASLVAAVFPRDIIHTSTPYFSWPSVPDAVRYLLWVNDDGRPNIEGKINNVYTPSEAHCPPNNGQYCKVYPNVQFSSQGGQWWVTVFFVNGYTNHVVINGLLFSIQ